MILYYTHKVTRHLHLTNNKPLMYFDISLKHKKSTFFIWYQHYLNETH